MRLPFTAKQSGILVTALLVMVVMVNMRRMTSGEEAHHLDGRFNVVHDSLSSTHQSSEYHLNGRLAKLFEASPPRRSASERSATANDSPDEDTSSANDSSDSDVSSPQEGHTQDDRQYISEGPKRKDTPETREQNKAQCASVFEMLNIQPLSDAAAGMVAYKAGQIATSATPVDIDWTTPFPWDTYRDTLSSLVLFELLSFRVQLLPLLSVYCVSGDPILLRQAVAYIFDWAHHFPAVEWSENYATVASGWQDMEVGLRARMLALVYGLCVQRSDNVLWNTERREFDRLLGDHAMFIRSIPLDAALEQHRELHQLHMSLGLVSICLVGGRSAAAAINPRERTARMVEWKTFGEALFAQALTPLFSLNDALSKSHSSDYHAAFVELISTAARLGMNSASRHYHEYESASTRLDNNRRWFTMPDGLPVLFGDTSIPTRYLRRDIPAIKQKAIESMRSNFTCPPAKGGKAVFHEAGYAFACHQHTHETLLTPKSNGNSVSYLAVTAATHSHVHKHADDMSFSLFEGYRRVFVDTGKHSYKYGDGERLRSIGMGAHNTIMPLHYRWVPCFRPTGCMQGKDQLDRSGQEPAYGSGIVAEARTRAWGFAVLTENFGYERLKTRVMRAYLYRPGELLIIVDRVTRLSGGPHLAWQRHFHMAPGLELHYISDDQGNFTQAVRARDRQRHVPRPWRWILRDHSPLSPKGYDPRTKEGAWKWGATVPTLDETKVYFAPEQPVTVNLLRFSNDPIRMDTKVPHVLNQKISSGPRHRLFVSSVETVQRQTGEPPGHSVVDTVTVTWDENERTEGGDKAVHKLSVSVRYLNGTVLAGDVVFGDAAL